MKNQKSIFMCLLAGIVSCSFCMTASADGYDNSTKLKRGLLLKEKDNIQYRILDYNTNNDNVVNVLDLCRVKMSVIESNTPRSQHVEMSCAGPWISDDNTEITVPVMIKGNALGVSSVSFKVEYPGQYFTLDNVYAASNASVSFSANSGQVQYVVSDGENLCSEGFFVYLVFGASSSVPRGQYDIRLNDIQAAMIDKTGRTRELSKDECSGETHISFDFVKEEPVVTTVPVTTVTTLPETTTVSETTVTVPKQNRLSFSMNNAQISNDQRQLRVPVYMTGNNAGICSFSAVVKYDRNKFSLTGVERGDFDGYGYVSGNMDNAVFNTNNNQNISQTDGKIAVLVFEVKNGTDQNTYDFELTDIKAAKSENWNQKQIDDLERKSEIFKYSFDGGIKVTTEPQVTEAPAATTTTTVTTITTTVSVTEPPADPVTQQPVTTTTPTPTQTEPAGYALNDEQLWFVEQVNNYRASIGKSKMTIVNNAFKAADERAKMLSQSFTVKLPDGRDYKWALYDNNVIPMRSSQSIDGSSTTKESALSEYLTKASAALTDNSFNKFAVGHYVDANGHHYWAMFTFG